MAKQYPLRFMKKIVLIVMVFGMKSYTQNITFPDANLKTALLNATPTNYTAYNSNGPTVVDINNDGEIQLSEAQVITGLNVSSNNITDFTGIENFTNLISFSSYGNPIAVLELNGFSALTNINISQSFGSKTSFVFNNLPSVTHISLVNSNITSIQLENLNSLTNVAAWSNSNLSTLHLISLPSLAYVWANDCNISNFSITNSPLLVELNLNDNNLFSIGIANFPNLEKLYLQGNSLTSIVGFTDLGFLKELNVQNNLITNIQFPAMPSLRFLICGSNGFSSIDLSNFPQLRGLAVNNNQLTNINLSNNLQLQQLNISFNSISSADFSMLANLTTFGCTSNLFTEIDLSGSPLLNGLSFADNPNLTHVNLKSGTISTIGYNSSGYNNLGNLQYICVDEGDTFNYNTSALPNLVVTSYCSFSPGGDYNTIQGIARFDATSDGCDASDYQMQHFKVMIDDGIETASTFSNSNGYKFYTEAGNFDLTPQIENASFFNFSPATFSVNFPDDNNNVYNQDFCITPNGIHQDLEIVLAPTVPARPGFSATYQITYHNKGNTILPSDNIGVSLAFDSNKMAFVSASETVTASTIGSLNFGYMTLHPFESRTILVTFLVNEPTAANPVNIGDVLTFVAQISPNTNDENANDNSFIFNQTVVGSYDPNDITCLEGNSVSTAEIGSYLHYIVNFENTGNYLAENVVVKIDMDSNKYDLNTLQLLSTSHNDYTRIKGERVEFIFENINLAALGGNPPVGGHGNVLFKIKSKDNLVSGDSVSKRANIYFDYNFPITTNNAVTTFNSLNNTVVRFDESILIYPNPTNGNININSKYNINTIELYDIQGRVLETTLESATTTTLDISNRENGIYFLKINTENGSKVEKIVKE